MKKQMLIVCGASSVGKSTSIKLAYNSFLRWSIKTQGPTDVKIFRESGREIVATIRFGSDLVGFSSPGDVAGEIIKAFGFLVEESCTIIVCATRSGGEPLETARKLGAKSGYHIDEWPKVREPVPPDENKANSKFARKIMTWVMRAGGW